MKIQRQVVITLSDDEYGKFARELEFVRGQASAIKDILDSYDGVEEAKMRINKLVETSESLFERFV